MAVPDVPLNRLGPPRPSRGGGGGGCKGRRGAQRGVLGLCSGCGRAPLADVRCSRLLANMPSKCTSAVPLRWVLVWVGSILPLYLYSIFYGYG
jgi:hypothetical protein